MQKKRMLFPIIAVSIIIFLIVAYFIFDYTVKKITEREVKRITQEEIGRITNEETGKITQNGLDRTTDEIIKQKTEEITKEIIGGSSESESSKLKEVNCDKTPLPRQFSSDSYYTGPLIDSHIHMPFTFEAPKALYEEADWDAPILEKDVFVGDIICAFDKEKINSVFGYYIIPAPLKGLAIQPIIQVNQQHPIRIAPFLMSTHMSSLDITSEDMEQIIDSNPGLFKGIGEIAFYKGSYKGVSPDALPLRKIYEVADKYNLMVMIHPDQNQQPAIEGILKDYPGVSFLFHGGWEMDSYAIEIVEKYPNAYFTIDGDLWDIINELQSVSLYGTKNKDEFIAGFKRDYNKIQRTAITKWKNAIEKYPDKFLWGTDRAFLWHFDPEVGALIEESARSFIGQLDPAVQEKFAYKNAERLLEER